MTKKMFAIKSMFKDSGLVYYTGKTGGHQRSKVGVVGWSRKSSAEKLLAEWMTSPAIKGLDVTFEIVEL